MDDGAEQSFCEFLGIENHDGHEIPGVSTPDGLEEQPESEKPGVEPSVLSPSVFDETVPLNSDRDSSSSATFDIDKQVRIALPACCSTQTIMGNWCLATFFYQSKPCRLLQRFWAGTP